ncbi:CDC27 family protein [Micromonospora sp. WMMD714]|uniref:CDC27 family protein n=1 Tax=Micromonospora sp. WMMD714 TaxID=3016097 RepID=UPI00249A71D8|nr:CDC27 family protein [Micromonospora sp. WMMD714]WFE64267.1 CDC27 family protein [Micromonospora sp. WMMD714]
MARTYTPDLIAAAVRQVEAVRATGRRGPISTVARELRLDRRLLQTWVTKARAHAAAAPAAPTTDVPVLLPDGLLHCGFCRQPMTAVFTCAGLVYDCPPPCRRPVLNATAVAHTVGEVVLRHAAHLVPALTDPKGVSAAAGHAHRLITRVTAGTDPGDLRITWPTSRPPRRVPPGHLHLARRLTGSDPQRTRTILRNILTGIDPATTAVEVVHADAAHLLAPLLHGQAAIDWAEYAHRSFTHLHGLTDPLTLTAAHTLATAHRQAGHHQRAYHLLRDLAEHLTATVGPDAHPTLAVRATTALVLHDLGHHHAARTLLTDTIGRHRRTHPGHPATARMTEHLDRLWHHHTTGHHATRHDSSRGAAVNPSLSLPVAQA